MILLFLLFRLYFGDFFSNFFLKFSNFLYSRKKYGHRQPLSKIQITKILSKGGKVVSEIKADKIKLSNDQISDKKSGVKKQQVTKKTAGKKTVVKTKNKK